MNASAQPHPEDPSHVPLLTSHGRTLLAISRDPEARLRDIAAQVGVTERATHKLVSDLVRAGHVHRLREGRRSHYELASGLPVGEAAELGALGSSEDVAPPVAEAETALDEAEHRFRLLVEQIPAVTYIASNETGLGEIDPAAYISPQMEELLGYAPDEFHSDPLLWRRLVHPDDREAVIAADNEAGRTGEPFLLEYRMIARDGRVVWIRDQSVLLQERSGGKALWLGVASDITATRLAEREQASADSRFRTLVERLPVFTYLQVLGRDDPNERRFVYMGPQVAAATGYTAEECMADPQILDRLIHPDDLERVLAHDEEARQSGGPFQLEYRIVARDGRVLWIRDHATVLPDEDGGPDLWLGVSYDITKQRETEAALRDSEQLFRGLVESLPAYTYVEEAGGAWVYASPQLEELTGIPTAERLADRDALKRRIHPDDRERIEAEDERTNQTGEPYDVEFRLVRPDGRTVWLHDHAVRIEGRDGVPDRWLGVTFDITERRLAEETLRAGEERFRSIFESAPIGAAVVDADGALLDANDAFGRMIGLSPGDLVGRDVAEITHPEEVDDMRALRGAVIAGEIPSYQVARRVLRPDGTLVRTRVTVAPLRQEDAPIATIALVEDVTTAVELEEQLRQAQKMEAVGRLAGGVAHDFNNVLTAIGGNAQLALAAIPEGDPVREMLDEIVHASERAAGLTRQLLSFSRKAVVRPRVLDLNDAVLSAQRMLRRLIGEDVELEARLDPETWPIAVDPSQLDQVLINLAVNAREAMPAGGRLVLSTRNAPASASDGHEGLPCDHVVLQVADTGEGMDDETLEHLFEPFFTTRPDGTGLGLATVYGIVTGAGGAVEAASRPGDGATFTILLPRAKAESASAGQVAPPPRGGSETILLVEDEAAVRALGRRALEARGYVVLEASSPEEALRLAESRGGDVDLVVSDVVMPGMNGHRLLEELQPLLPGVRSLLVSGYDAEWVASRGEPDPGTAFLAKPFTPDQLGGTVRELLDADV